MNLLNELQYIDLIILIISLNMLHTSHMEKSLPDYNQYLVGFGLIILKLVE